MDFSKLDLYMDQMTLRGIPGCEISVTRDGETVYRKCVGFSDAAGTKPVCRDDIYFIYSASKIVTCIAALRLVEEGKISLDDPVSKYIPEFANARVKRGDGSITPAKNVMTVEHLFLMGGGLTYDFDHEGIRAAEDKSALGIARVISRAPLAFEPGTRYKYSLCHDVLAALIEAVTGMRFSEYLKAVIFDPLGIKDMGCFPNGEQRARMSCMYNYRNGVGVSVPMTDEQRAEVTYIYESGGGGLFATVDDYMKIITVIACGGTTKDGYRLLKAETVELMKENRLCPEAHDDFVSHRLFGYGWGLCGRVHIDPIRSGSKSAVGEFGWDGAAGAFVLVDTENRIAVYYGQHVMKCGIAAYSVHGTLKNLVYESLGL